MAFADTLYQGSKPNVVRENGSVFKQQVNRRAPHDVCHRLLDALSIRSCVRRRQVGLRFAASMIFIFFVSMAENVSRACILYLKTFLLSTNAVDFRSGWGDYSFNNPNVPDDTPFLTSLANKGVIFHDFHAGASVCTPSRAGEPSITCPAVFTALSLHPKLDASAVYLSVPIVPYRSAAHRP